MRPVRLVLLCPAAALHSDLHAVVTEGRPHVPVEVDIVRSELVEELLVVGREAGEGEGEEGEEKEPHAEGARHCSRGDVRSPLRSCYLVQEGRSWSLGQIMDSQ